MRLWVFFSVEKSWRSLFLISIRAHWCLGEATETQKTCGVWFLVHPGVCFCVRVVEFISELNTSGRISQMCFAQSQ